jgi:hypothetical protein
MVAGLDKTAAMKKDFVQFSGFQIPARITGPAF